jgi:diguanylate cyclase (GGDEF)-like protein
MYLLALLPLLTDILETGRWPVAPREWLTELLVGALIIALVRKIRQEHAALLTLAQTDALTGLGNRRAFNDALEGEFARMDRSHDALHRLSLAYMDIDHFKAVNDRLGHGAGDRVLQQLSDAIRQVARANFDHGFRIGGDEFVLLLPGSSLEQAEAVVARIQDHCESVDALWRDGSLGLSSGIVELKDDELPEAFLQRSDQAMYLAKSNRRLVRR